MTEINPKNLLDVAKGITDVNEILDESQKLEAAKNRWLTLPNGSKQKITHRKNLRSSLFKIIKYQVKETPEKMTIELEALKEIIDGQLDANLGLSWEGFTFVWDIHPSGKPEIVRRETWGKEGGSYDPDLGLHYPSAFTSQEIN